MSKLITYVPPQCSKDGKEYAFDEDGEHVNLEFNWFGTPKELSDDGVIEQKNYVRLDGVIHRCWDLHISMGLIVFWAEPSPDAISFDDWTKQEKPLDGVSVATSQPFIQWMGGRLGASVNHDNFDPLCPKCKKVIDGCYGGCLACDLDDDLA